MNKEVSYIEGWETLIGHDLLDQLSELEANPESVASQVGVNTVSVSGQDHCLIGARHRQALKHSCLAITARATSTTDRSSSIAWHRNNATASSAPTPSCAITIPAA
jgi:hypothetical protein